MEPELSNGLMQRHTNESPNHIGEWKNITINVEIVSNFLQAKSFSFCVIVSFRSYENSIKFRNTLIYSKQYNFKIYFIIQIIRKLNFSKGLFGKVIS